MTIKTPWDDEIALLQAAERRGHLWDDALRDFKSQADSYRQGYADAEARHAPLVEAAQRALDWLGDYWLDNYGRPNRSLTVLALVEALAQVKEAK